MLKRVRPADNARVQTFDIHGNPVKYLQNKAESTLSLTVESRGQSTNLGLDVGAKGYVYVLTYTGDGSAPDDTTWTSTRRRAICWCRCKASHRASSP